MPKKKVCYVCGKEATTREHIPPKCIFPQDSKYRNNLITVSSCKQHNNDKSDDDEYLLFVLVANILSNDFAMIQWNDKVRPAYNSSPKKLGIFNNLNPIQIDNISTGTYQLDKDRFDKQIIKICKGLYLHHFNLICKSDFEIFLPSAFSIGSNYSHQLNTITKVAMQKLNLQLSNQKQYGNNPDIFFYKFIRQNSLPNYIVQLNFYGNIQIGAIAKD